jgi:hypothetical protein
MIEGSLIFSFPSEFVKELLGSGYGHSSLVDRIFEFNDFFGVGAVAEPDLGLSEGLIGG